MCKIFAGIGIIIGAIIGMFLGNMNISGDAFLICISLGTALLAVGFDSQNF